MSCITPRQLQCLELAAQGMSSKEISARLRLTVSTVKSYRSRALRAMGAISTAHAVALALSRGMIGRCSVAATEAEAILVRGRAA